MTVSERISAYKKFLDAVLSAGPDIQDDLSDLTVIRQAVDRIISRTTKRFGMRGRGIDIITDDQWQEIRADDEVRNLEHQVAQRVMHQATVNSASAATSLPPNSALGAADAQAGNIVRPHANPPASSGQFIELLQQVFEFLMQHPELLTLLINLFKPQPAPTP